MPNAVTRRAAAAAPLRALLLRFVLGGPASAERREASGGVRVAGPAPLSVLILGGAPDGRVDGREEGLDARLAERLHVVTGRGVRVAVDRSPSPRTGDAPLPTAGSELSLVVYAPALDEVLGLSRRRRRARVLRWIARIDAAAGTASWLVLSGTPRPRVDSRADRLMRLQCDVVDADLRRAGARLDAVWNRTAAEGIVQRLIEGDPTSEG